jgi:hypothetical protein
MKKILFLFNLLLLTIVASGKNYYVSETGSDLNGGTTIATSWKTLSKVQSFMTSFKAGDSILFKRDSKFTGTLQINGKSNLYFGAYGTGQPPLFWGKGTTVDPLVWIIGCSNITFYGIKISDTTISLSDRAVQAKILIAFQFDNSSSNTIRKCTMDRVGVGVFYSSTTSPSNTIDSCDIGNMRMVKNTPTSVNNNDDYGANPTVISSASNIITSNYFHDCWAISYDYGYDGGAIEFFGDGVNNNFIAYNTFIDCNGTVEHGSSRGGTMSGNKFVYNKVINCGKLFYINNSTTSGFQVSVTNLQFYNNVIIESYVNRLNQSTMGSMSVSVSTPGIVVFKNNIVQLSSGINFVSSNQFNSGQMVHTNNVFKLSKGTIGLTLGSTEVSTTSTFWTNTTNTNPLYWDYRPLNNSLLINKGISVSLIRDFSNNPVAIIPEIGLLEYLSTSLRLEQIQKNKHKSLFYNYENSTIFIDSDRKYVLSIYNSFGQTIYRAVYEKYSKPIDLSFLKSGFYIASNGEESIEFMVRK